MEIDNLRQQRYPPPGLCGGDQLNALANLLNASYLEQRLTHPFSAIVSIGGEYGSAAVENVCKLSRTFIVASIYQTPQLHASHWRLSALPRQQGLRICFRSKKGCFGRGLSTKSYSVVICKYSSSRKRWWLQWDQEPRWPPKAWTQGVRPYTPLAAFAHH